jgi:pimeloyl-ACP methyl ester carboxylesterase
MPYARSNGIQIEYETFGDPAGRPLLLIMGLGAQMVLWDEQLCEELASQGHFVVPFDNRDVGLSTKLDEHGTPNVLELMQRSRAGEDVAAPYSLDDMANDAAGLLDAIGIDAAHVCGASMGGMIAQTLAIRHPAPDSAAPDSRSDGGAAHTAAHGPRRQHRTRPRDLEGDR